MSAISDVLDDSMQFRLYDRSRTIPSRRDRLRLRNSWSCEYDSTDAFLPPKHPGVHRSSALNTKQETYCETDSTVNRSYENSNPRNSWSGESDSKDYFLVPRKSLEIQRFPTISSHEWETNQTSQSSGNSASCESDSKEEFTAIHRSFKPKKTQRVVSWDIDLMSGVIEALNDTEIRSCSPRNARGAITTTQKYFVNGESPVMHRPPNLETKNHADFGDLDRCSQSSTNSVDSRSYANEVVFHPSMNSRIRHIPDFSDHKKLMSREDEVRHIVNGILEELRPPRSERSISCSSSCSGCCSCCYDSCSCIGPWTPRPSTPAVDIPRIRPKLAFLPRIHGHPSRMDSPRRPSCSCTQCNKFKTSIIPPPILSPASWITSSLCSQCLPPFDKDSLDSKISLDSLAHQSIFSVDSLNSLTDPDSLEYTKTNISIDSLDSLDSCCNYDSLSDSKDSGFFSCSLPAVC